MKSIVKYDKPVNTEGKVCANCGGPIEYKTSSTMLCKKCQYEWIAERASETMQSKYGISNAMESPEFIKKIRDTMLDKYGVKCAMEVPEFRKKYEETCKEKLGVSYYVNSPDFVQNSLCKSKTNERFCELLKENNIDYDVEVVKEDKRFDIEIIGRKIFIEIDPTYTHTVAGNHWDTEGLPKEKHIIKTLVARKNGYRCIHVFDWDDWNSIIDLIKPTSTVYARKCEIKEIQDKSYDDFIDANHIQKNCKGTAIALGLYLNGDLLQVMTFGKPRYNKNYEWELLRLCTKKGITVVGGANKLFKYATTNMKLASIISYCDRSKFTGEVYKKMGMKLLRESVPQEVWSKGKERITGSLLRQRGYDQLFNASYGKGTSNEQLMLEHGWLPVYDCGQLVFGYGSTINNEDSGPADKDCSQNYAKMLASISRSKEKLCEFCKEPFVPNSSHQRYCKRPHYMKCPVCGKQYLVTNNENLKKPPVACSYECRKVRREQTSLERYGIKAPGNNPEAREKAKATTREKFGVDYAMQSKDVRSKAVATLKERYGVDNIKKVTEITTKDMQRREEKFKKDIIKLLPLKMSTAKQGAEILNTDELSDYILNEKCSVEFLNSFGFSMNMKRGKIHLSLGLVKDKVIYQVMRFERRCNEIILADFGTRDGFFDSSYYSRLLNVAINTCGVEEFNCRLPRYLVTPELLNSLKLKKIEDGMYDVYWLIEGKKVKLSRRDDIVSMKTRYDYTTTDYLDLYQFSLDATENQKLV